jgi:outer membrane protein
MNTLSKAIITLIFSFLMIAPAVSGQEAKKGWTLRNCIDFAIQNNIQVKKMQVGVNVNEAGYEQSKAARIPSLNAGASESFTHQKPLQSSSAGEESSLSGNYSLRSDMTLYNGLKLTNSIAQQQIFVKSAELGVTESQNNIELAVTAAYLQVLYARESVNNAVNTLSASKAQVDQARIKYDAGYIAESNFAQVQAQYSSDSYALVTAQNNLSLQLLNLKQLLEFDINQELNLYFPELSDSTVLKPIPSKQEVYKTALTFLPEVEIGQLSIHSAEYDIKIAKAGYIPSLSLSASASTGYDNKVAGGFSTQLGDNFYQNVGLSLSVPIFNNKLVKSAVSRATLGLETAQLNDAATLKDLQSRVESAYLNAVSAQSRFQAAVEQLRSTNKSYSLLEEQFNLGMKNTVDLLTEKTKFLAAQEEYLQAKYTAILNYKLLDFYQQKKIEL